jgi:hypothetical protein
MKRPFVFFLLSGISLLSAQATTLDWNSVNWPSGNLTQSFNIDPANSGNDITITISGNTGNLISNVNDTTDLTGGGSTSQESLYLNTDHSSLTQALTITLDFSYTGGVSGVSFSVFDVDFGAGQFQDQLFNISGTDGTNVYYASLTGSANNTIANNGTATATATGNIATAENSGDANVSFNFGSNIVTSVTFSWGNAPTANNPPGNQWIGLSDINYTAAPEPSTIIATMLLLCAAFYHHLHKIRNRENLVGNYRADFLTTKSREK